MGGCLVAGEIVEGGLWKWRSLSLWVLCEGNLEGVSFTGHPEGYVQEGSGDEHLFP